MNRLVIISRFLGDPLFGAAFAPLRVTLMGDLIEGVSEDVQAASQERYEKYLNVEQKIVSRKREDLFQGAEWNKLLLLLMNQRTPSSISDVLPQEIFDEIPPLCQRFVDAVLSLHLDLGDVICIYGLHLPLLPKMLREANVANKIYLHTGHVLPADELLRIIPELDQYLSSMLCSNVLLFQSDSDLNEFKSIAARTLGVVYNNGVFLPSEYSNGYEVICRVSAMGRNLKAIKDIDPGYFCSAFGIDVDKHGRIADQLAHLKNGNVKKSENVYRILSLDTCIDDPISLSFRIKTIENLYLQGYTNIEYVCIFSTANTYGTPFPQSNLTCSADRFERFKEPLSMIANLNATYSSSQHIPIRIYWELSEDLLEYLVTSDLYWESQSYGMFSLPLIYVLLLNQNCHYLVNETSSTALVLQKCGVFDTNHFSKFKIYDPMRTSRQIINYINNTGPNDEFVSRKIVERLVRCISLTTHVNDVKALYEDIKPYIRNKQKLPKLVNETALFSYLQENVLWKYKYTILIINVRDALSSSITNRTPRDIASNDHQNIYGEANKNEINDKIRNQRIKTSRYLETPKTVKGQNKTLDQDSIAFKPVEDFPLPAIVDLFDKIKNKQHSVDLDNDISYMENCEKDTVSMLSSPTLDGTSACNKTVASYDTTNCVTMTASPSGTLRGGSDCIKKRSRFSNACCTVKCAEQNCGCIDQHDLLDLIVIDQSTGESQWYDADNVTILIENGHAVKFKNSPYFQNEAYIDNAILEPIRDLMYYYNQRCKSSYILENYTNITFCIQNYDEDSLISLNHLIGHLESGGLIKDERLSLSRTVSSVTVSINKHLLKQSLEKCILRLTEESNVSLSETALIVIGQMPYKLFDHHEIENRPFIYGVSVNATLSSDDVRLKNRSATKVFLMKLLNFYAQYKRPAQEKVLPHFNKEMINIRKLIDTNEKKQPTLATQEQTNIAASNLVNQILQKNSRPNKNNNELSP